MAEGLRKLSPERIYFEVEEPSAGATFRKRPKHVRAWRWQPHFNEGSIVPDPGSVRLENSPGDDGCAWVHPCGVVTPDNGNPSWCVVANGALVRPRNGDVIIMHTDGTREVMSAERFVQEYEPE